MFWNHFMNGPFLDAEGGGSGGAGGEGAGSGGDPGGQGNGGEGAGSGAGGTGGQGGGEGFISKESASAAIRAEKAKLEESFKHHKAIVERLTKASGLTPDQIAQRLDAQFGGGQAPAGMSPEMLAAFGGMQNTIKQTQTEAKNLSRSIARDKLKADPRFSDFDTVKDAVEKYADDHNVDLETAYWAVNGSKASERMAREAEQRLIANREQYGYLGAVGGDSPVPAGGAKFENADQALIARVFDMSPEEFKGMSGEKMNLDDYEALQVKLTKKR